MADKRGAEWEAVALERLQGAGLRLLARNYSCRFGELDLVMQEGDALVFVEVRYRRSTRFGSAAESVNGRKQERLMQAARHYLQHSSIRGQPDCRFDVVAISGGQGEQLEWIVDAFGE